MNTRKKIAHKFLILRRLKRRRALRKHILRIREFINRFRTHYVPIELMKVGCAKDGGYLVPSNLERVRYCFSPGTGSEVSFEKHLSEKYNIRCFLADRSVEKSPVEDKNFKFTRKFLGNKDTDSIMTLESWLNSALDDNDTHLLLQMDIEGSEYDILIYTTDEVLKRFQYMVIEFHFLEKLKNEHFFMMVSAVFKKLYKNFSIAHVHPNNCCGIESLTKIQIPRTIEVTFIRNDVIASVRTHTPISLPHPLDRKNTDNPDIVMPTIWWKKEIR